MTDPKTLTDERYCLFCEKSGHRTNECYSTHGINTPHDRELMRLARATREQTASTGEPERFVPIGRCTCAGPDGPCEACIENREAYEEWKADRAAPVEQAGSPPLVNPAQPSGMTITLCGSARFERLFKAWNEALTMAGHTVFTLTAFPSDKGAKGWYTPEQKIALDGAHFRKIAASDAIFVINRHAYIGESTMREIEYAKKLGKSVFMLESWGLGYGIGGCHTDAAQAAKLADGIPAGYMSPISTTTREGYCDPWAGWLLGPAGVLRSSLVALVNDAKAPADCGSKATSLEPGAEKEQQ